MPMPRPTPGSHMEHEELALAAADLEHVLAAQVVALDPARGELVRELVERGEKPCVSS